MKKILFYALLLISSFAIAQPPISSYYPAPLYFEQSWLTPMGYVEFNHVSTKLQRFMSSKMEMSLNDDKTVYDVGEKGVGTITMHFTDKFSVGTTPKTMALTFNVFALDHNFIIESVKMTGDQNRLRWFFVQYWPTTLTLDDLGSKKIAHNYLYQDEAAYYGNYIEVKNNTIKSKEEFFATYNKAVADQETKKLETAKRKELEAIKKAAERETYETVTVNIKKNRNGIEFDNVPQELQSHISEYLKNKDNGDYVLRINKTIQNNTITNANIYTDKFEPTVGKKLFNRLISN